MCLATKQSHFIFNNILYIQIDRVAMQSSLGPSLAHALLTHNEQNCQDSWPWNIDLHIIDGML